jgi:hypothetical protein
MPSGDEHLNTHSPLIDYAFDSIVVISILSPVLGWVGSVGQEENHARRATQKTMMLKRY